jgi:hypothetical protein
MVCLWAASRLVGPASTQSLPSASFVERVTPTTARPARLKRTLGLAVVVGGRARLEYLQENGLLRGGERSPDGG